MTGVDCGLFYDTNTMLINKYLIFSSLYLHSFYLRDKLLVMDLNALYYMLYVFLREFCSVYHLKNSDLESYEQVRGAIL